MISHDHMMRIWTLNKGIAKDQPWVNGRDVMTIMQTRQT